jgi:hemerythrin-like domain-containing protein
MPEMLHHLTRDHRNLARLLDLVERQVEVFAAGGGLDFELLDSILDYVLHHPNLYHHPREDLIYRRLLERDPAARKTVAQALAEHDRLRQVDRAFADVVRNIEREAELPRSWILDTARTFVEETRAHMEREESDLFPRARRCLTEADWQEIDAALTTPTDPLFAGAVEDRYRALHEQIMRLGA